MSDVTMRLGIVVSPTESFRIIRQLLPALDEAQLTLLLADVGEAVGASVNWGDSTHDQLVRLRRGIAALPGDAPADDRVPLPVRPRVPPEASKASNTP